MVVMYEAAGAEEQTVNANNSLSWVVHSRSALICGSIKAQATPTDGSAAFTAGRLLTMLLFGGHVGSSNDSVWDASLISYRLEESIAYYKLKCFDYDRPAVLHRMFDLLILLLKPS